MDKSKVINTTTRVMKGIISVETANKVLTFIGYLGLEGTSKLADAEKENVDKLINQIASGQDPQNLLSAVSEDTQNAFVVRYFASVRHFTELDQDDISFSEDLPDNPKSLWASVMLADIDMFSLSSKETKKRKKAKRGK